MSEQFPIFRLATLLARQMSAPIAARIKEYARAHPVFRRQVCVRLGRAHRAADTRFKLWTLQLRQPRALAPLPEAAALHAGADILGEMVIFSLGAAIIIFEVNRQANNQEAKKLDKMSQRLAVRLQLEELALELARQERDLQRLRAALQRLAGSRCRAREGDSQPRRT